MINRVILVGRLTRDPELRKTSNGNSVCSFSLAVNRRFKSPGQPDADFINCTAWGKTADVICQYLHKGSLISLEGRLQTRSYENQQGQRVYVTEVVIENFDFLESKNSQLQNGNYGQNQNYGYDQSQNGYGSQNGYNQNSYNQSNNAGGYGNSGYNNSGYGNSGRYNPNDFSGGYTQTKNTYQPYGDYSNQEPAYNSYSKPDSNEQHTADTSKANSGYDSSETLDIADDDLPF